MEPLAVISLTVAAICSIVIVVDELRRPQPMAIMNIVWPVTALYGSVAALIFYWRVGRAPVDRSMSHMQHAHGDEAAQTPRWTQSALAASHCGAGCVLADIVIEWSLFATGAVLFGSALWASYVWDFAAAWLLGIVFQYFSIQPMRHLPVAQAIVIAIKADTWSILAYQVGMYAWMALVWFVFFPAPHLHPNQPAYWFMMQVAMLCGFLTSLPMNRLLLRIGWKEAMG